MVVFYVFGFVFGFGWILCIGLIFGVILIVSVISVMIGEGVVLFVFYLVGFGILFLVVVGFIDSIVGRLCGIGCWGCCLY